MVLVVTEKPSVGRDIARVLRCTERGEGFLRNDRYVITWAMGHLVTLKEPDELDEKYKHWRREDLPILPEEIPTKVISKTRKQYSIVKNWLLNQDVESVICATDAGREGELIFGLIYRQAKCTKPVQRLWISSMTDAAIREGFSNLRPEDEYRGLYASALCRAKADWYVGMNLSRAFSIRYHALLSVGRVQTPTLAILVKRAQEIASFVPEEYRTLTADFGLYEGIWFDPEVKGEKESTYIRDPQRAEELASLINGKDGTVKKITVEQKKEFCPQLYDLTALQRDANSRYGFTADKTLKLTQELYEKWKLVTYPRTDSRYLSEDIYPKLPGVFRKLPDEYREKAEDIPMKEDGKLPFSKRVFDGKKVTDHHAIIPTPQTADLTKLTEDLKKIYDLIALRTIAVFYPPYEYEATKVITQVEDQLFRSTGRTVLHPGWRAVSALEPTGKKQKDPEKELPRLEEGQQVAVHRTRVKKDTTKPPAPHTDSSLLYAMENAGRQLDDEALREQMKGSGLGTPATRAAMIERLVKVGYASRKGRTIQATEKGIELIALAPEEMTSPELTGQWELKLNQIAAGKGEDGDFISRIMQFSARMVGYALNDAQEHVFRDEKKKPVSGAGKREKLGTCPLCGRDVMENSKGFYCGGWKTGCKFTLWKDCLTRGKGPGLNARIMTLLLEKGEVTGSTGTIRLSDGELKFIPKEAQEPSVTVPILYEKKARDQSGAWREHQ